MRREGGFANLALPNFGSAKWNGTGQLETAALRDDGDFGEFWCQCYTFFLHSDHVSHQIDYKFPVRPGPESSATGIAAATFSPI